LSQDGVVGPDGDAVDEVADVQLGLTKEVAVALVQEGAHDGEDVVLGGVKDLLGDLLGEGFLLGGKSDGRHGTSVAREQFRVDTAASPFVYKNSTNFRDAHPRKGVRLGFA
jgi:hypothetical protein